MYYIAIRRRKLLATVRVQSSLIVMDIWSLSNWSECCSRTILPEDQNNLIEEIQNVFWSNRGEFKSF